MLVNGERFREARKTEMCLDVTYKCLQCGFAWTKKNEVVVAKICPACLHQHTECERWGVRWFGDGACCECGEDVTVWPADMAESDIKIVNMEVYHANAFDYLTSWPEIDE